MSIPLHPFVSFTVVDASKISNLPVGKKEIKKDGSLLRISWYEIGLLYDYSALYKEQIRGLTNEFWLEGPELVSRDGILEAKCTVGTGSNANTTSKHYIDTICQVAHPEHRKFISTMQEIHSTAAKIVGDNSTALGAYRSSNIELSHFRCPFMPWLDKKVKDGADIIGHIQLYNCRRRKTIFTDLLDEVLDWQELVGVEIRFIPILHVAAVYWGDSRGIRVRMVSAVITEFKKAGLVTLQQETTGKYRVAHPEKVEKYRAQKKAKEMRQAGIRELTEPMDYSLLVAGDPYQGSFYPAPVIPALIDKPTNGTGTTQRYPDISSFVNSDCPITNS